MVATSNKTLAALTGTDLGLEYPSGTVRAVHRAWCKPLRDLEPDDVRAVLAQAWKDSVPIVVPLALAFLEADPLLAATYYEGDLLSCLCSPELDAYWSDSRHGEQLERARGIVEAAKERLEEHQLLPAVSKALIRFRRAVLDAGQPPVS